MEHYNDDLLISTLLNNSEYSDDDMTEMEEEDFALELQLQEAIAESSKKGGLKLLCEICAETKENDGMFPIEECGHCYCKDCISKHVSIELDKGRIVITCPGADCNSVLELDTCGAIVHPDVRHVWDENRRRSVTGDGDDDDDDEGEDLGLHHLAKEKKWQRCPRCKFYVEKMDDSCLHMTCRCQFQFCYACGKAWSVTHGGCQ